MKQTTRELLVTTKVAQSWQDRFDSNVDGLMSIVSKVDNEEHVEKVTELMDVYHNKVDEASPPKSKKNVPTGRPFEFKVFCN
ncbi:MAG: hypothetical protein H6551_01750 [Chitinophagales bacterium]|nr:hypothetical protein [Chitinophagaceae bacterium]MCB9063848.1 hypothetical protein [Chitinophagales bacterium]